LKNEEKIRVDVFRRLLPGEKEQNFFSGEPERGREYLETPSTGCPNHGEPLFRQHTRDSNVFSGSGYGRTFAL
jgi:hypothetical protein